MPEYVKQSITKGARTDDTAKRVLITSKPQRPPETKTELRHGEWIEKARATLKLKRFGNATFALLIIFFILFVGSVFLFENMEILTGPLYAIKIVMTSLFAVTLGFILSVWWSTAARYDEKIRDAERIDLEYRELLMSFSDSLFDIINALNTLAAKPPRPFVVASEFLLGEYVHLLQSQLQRYGDYVAGLGFDATAFLDEKIRIFEGIRERASLSVKGMPKELETLFVASLNLDSNRFVDKRAQHQAKLQEKLKSIIEEQRKMT